MRIRKKCLWIWLLYIKLCPVWLTVYTKLCKECGTGLWGRQIESVSMLCFISESCMWSHRQKKNIIHIFPHNASFVLIFLNCLHCCSGCCITCGYWKKTEWPLDGRGWRKQVTGVQAFRKEEEDRETLREKGHFLLQQAAVQLWCRSYASTGPHSLISERGVMEKREKRERIVVSCHLFWGADCPSASLLFLFPKQTENTSKECSVTLRFEGCKPWNVFLFFMSDAKPWSL